MIGQTFAPIGDPMQQRPGGPQGQQGAEQAIQVLNTRLPRVVGAGAPAPQALLSGAGSAGLPQQTVSPVLQQILQAVLGHFAPQQMSAPSAPGGMVMGAGMGSMSGPAGPAAPLPMPAVHYQPPPGGTAGPSPVDRRPDTPQPGGKMNGFDYKR